MKIKKFLASILVFTTLVSSLSLPVFADGVKLLNGNAPTYLGKNIDLNSWITYNVPSFNGVPDRVPGDTAFFSNKGEIKLKIDNNNRSYFENGGSLLIYVKKAEKKFHLNPFNWSDFLAYKTENGINSFKINGPSQSLSQLFNGNFFQLFNNILSLIYPNSASSFFISSLIFTTLAWCFSWGTAFKFALSSLFAPSLVKLATIIGAPVFNLLANTNPNNVNFDYGIVLTDKDDEQVLNPNLPKEGEINEKALGDWKKQTDKENKILVDNKLKSSEAPLLGGIGIYGPKIPKNCYYTQQDIDKMKKTIDEHKAITYAKLASSAPINDGFVCRLDKDHPSQTFRFVINNQFPDNPNNVDLFALALQNNYISLTQNDSRVDFIAAYNAINPNSDVNSRLTNVPLEVQQKINLIQNVGAPGFLTKAIDWICSLKNHFTLSDGNTTTTPPAPEGAPRAQEVINSRNMDYLRKATELYQRQPTNVNASYLTRVTATLRTKDHLADNIAQNIDVAYNRLFSQRHWYDPRTWRQ